MHTNQNEIILYQPDSSLTLEVRLEDETVWLSLNQIAQLFNRDKSVISRHINNIFGEEELFINSVVANFATTAADGKIYQVEYFNLDVIISVGYPPVAIKTFTHSHDRFLFIDENVYHLGASLKDLGKRWFAFSKMELGAKVLLQNLNT